MNTCPRGFPIQDIKGLWHVTRISKRMLHTTFVDIHEVGLMPLKVKKDHKIVLNSFVQRKMAFLKLRIKSRILFAKFRFRLRSKFLEFFIVNYFRLLKSCRVVCR